MFTDLRTAALAAIEDGQFADAERHLRAVLADDPLDAIATAVLALCLAELGRLDEAQTAAARAVMLEPFLPYTHWVQGVLLVRRNRLAEALASATEALRLEPDDPDHHALLAQIHGAREQWPEALEAAEQGLALDQGHEPCANLRAVALRQLGHTEEATQAFAAAAAANPLNAFAAAGKGWGDLAEGRTADADASFRDALLFDPGSEWAREGLLATLKSRSPVYRQLLRYFLWMSRRSGRERTMYAIGGVVGYNALRRMADAAPEVAPFIWPVLIAYAVFVVLTWIADPLLDLMLSFDSAGRRLLSPDRLWAGRAVGGCLVLALLLGLGSMVDGAAVPILGAVGVALLVLPLAGVFQCEPGWPRRVMALYTSVLAVLLVVSMAASADVRGSVFALVIVGIVLGTWLARWLASVTPAR